MISFSTPAVADAFAALPDASRQGCLQLRALIFEIAQGLDQPVDVTEDLRWGQPAYLSTKGTTIRLGVPKTAQFGLFVHCQTRLLSDLHDVFPMQDRVEGTRAVLFDDPADIDATRHGWLIARALTYHR